MWRKKIRSYIVQRNIRWYSCNIRFLGNNARGADDGDTGAAVAAEGVTDGDLEARRRRLHRDCGGGVVARLVVGPTERPGVVPREERHADGAVRGDLLNAQLVLTRAEQ